MLVSLRVLILAMFLFLLLYPATAMAAENCFRVARHFQFFGSDGKRERDRNVVGVNIWIVERYWINALTAFEHVPFVPRLEKRRLHPICDGEKRTVHLERRLMMNLMLVDPQNYGVLRDFYQGVRTGDEQQIVLASAAN